MYDDLDLQAPLVSPRDALTLFAGGLDQETPAWQVPPGRVRDALNYEVAIANGYQDVLGYERFDGRDKPSDAGFTILDVTITGAINVGDVITGNTTLAHGTVVAIATYPDDPDQTYLVLGKVVGVFSDANEALTHAGVQGNTDAIGYDDSAPTPKLAAQYKALAADVYRAVITAVPGEGSVWGGFSLGADKYAIRNTVGSIDARLWKATATGWDEQDLGYELAFTSGGVVEISEGDTITGATSATTATVTRIQVMSGTWAGGDAAGYLTLDTPVGAGFSAENLDVGANANVATIAGSAGPIVLQPSGRLDYDTSNFADPAGPERIYGADGVNFGWEYDGTVFAFVRTGMAVDKPTHVAVHKNQLFFSFAGSLQHSSISDPMEWDPLTGEQEIQTGTGVITGFQVQPGATGDAALLVASRQRLHILYGNDEDDFNLIPYRRKVGAYEWTLQTIAYTVFLDDRGITSLQTTQNFGNFAHAALSSLVRTLINQKKSLAIASCVVRDKNQYRIFFSDKTAIYVTFAGNKILGMMPIKLEHLITTIWSEEDEDGNEEVFFGCDDGFVYQMEKGTSFDGANIYAYLLGHFDDLKSIEYNKEFFAPVTVQGKGTGYAEFDLGYQLDYGRSEVTQPINQTAVMPVAQAQLWDTGLAWDTFLTWDNAPLVPTVGLDLRGEGRNISWMIVKDSNYFQPLLLSGVHFLYVVRSRILG